MDSGGKAERSSGWMPRFFGATFRPGLGFFLTKNHFIGILTRIANDESFR